MWVSIKKSVFFLKTGWTVRVILTILMGYFFQFDLMCGDSVVTEALKKEDSGKGEESGIATIAELELRLKMAQKELTVLRKELASVLKQSEKRDQEYLRLQMSIAASVSDGKRKEYSKQDSELLQSFYSVARSGEELISMTTECCDFVEKILDQKSITDVDKVRSKLRLRKLKTAAAKFYMMIKPRQEKVLFRSCRVLDINDKLQVVVLNAGATSGMRSGILLRAESSDCELTVIMVRPFISVGVVTKGDIASLAKGSVLVPGK